MSDNAWHKDCWQIPGIKRADQFFAALPDLLSFPVYLRFEATGMAPDIRALLQSHSVDPALKIASGTLWPKPSVFHVMTSEDFMRDIVGLAGSHAEPEICDHLHAYDPGVLLLQWYDAFIDPLLVAGSIPESSLQKFCERLGVSSHR
jgi:hypothetical protein